MKTPIDFRRIKAYLVCLLVSLLLQVSIKNGESSIVFNNHNRFNVTTAHFMGTPLSGNYTVGTNGHFVSISDAVNVLTINGISGSTTFDILPGNYYENISIGTVLGTNPNNAVTFRSQTGNPADVTWITDGTALHLSGNCNIAIEGITFQYAFSNYPTNYIVHIEAGQHDLIRISKCKFNSLGINATGQDVKALEISQNEFFTVPASYHLVNASNINKVILQDNLFRGNAEVFQISGVDSVFIISNTITNLGNSIVGFQINDCNSTLRFEKNRISGVTNGLYFVDCNGSNNLIANNVVNVIPGAMWFTSCSNMKIIHNTFLSGIDCVGSIRFGYESTNTAVLNNLLLRAGYFYMFSQVTASNTQWDYNNMYPYFDNLADGGEYNGFSFYPWTLSNWRTISGNDSHSVTRPVYFESDGFHLTFASSTDDSLRGTRTIYVLEDIDGEPRDPERPFMGADEPNFGMSGTYLVGTGGDFPNIGSAVAELNSMGMNGPVEIAIMPGTYYESVTLDSIVGSSSINTLTIRSQSGNPDVNWNSSNYDSLFALNINGADFVVIKNIVFYYSYQEDLHPELPGIGLLLNGSIQNISIGECKFQVGGNRCQAFRSTYAIFGAATSVSRNLDIIDNEFICNSANSSNGIHLIGFSFNIQLKSNIMTGFKSGFRIDNCDSILVDGNKIVARGGGGSCINLFACTGFAFIQKNDLYSYTPRLFPECPQGSSNLGLWNCNFQKAVVSNNFMKSSGASIGAENSSQIDIFHNTLKQIGFVGEIIKLVDTDSVSLMGNILYCTESLGPKTYVVLRNSSISSNHNNFNPGNSEARIFDLDGAIFYSLDSWSTASGNDLHSYKTDVSFAEDEFHLFGSSITDSRLRSVFLGAVTDFDGEQRNPVRPFMGADEPDISWGLTLKVKLLTEGRYFPISNVLSARDSVKIIIRGSEEPYAIVDSSIGIIDSLSFEANVEFPYLGSGRYYIVVRQFNSIETWSKVGGEIFNSLDTINYDFTTSASQAYGDNLKLKGEKYCLISGDVFQDGFIDGSDLLIIDNDAYIFASGRFLASDLNGDGFTDAADMQIADNNNGREVIRP